jgi:hypothetical protein
MTDTKPTEPDLEPDLEPAAPTTAGVEPAAAAVERDSPQSDSAKKAKGIERDERGYFKKGNPPGPGRPKGLVNETVQMARRMFSENAREIVQVIIDKAKQGDPTAMKLCLDRILPTIVEAHRMKMGGFAHEDIVLMLGDILQAMRNAQLRAEQIVLVRDRMLKFFPVQTPAIDVDVEGEATG